MVSRGEASHLGSALSMVEIMTAIYKLVDIQKIKDQTPDRDRVILSKGHGAACMYAVMYHYGMLNQGDIDSYCQNGSTMAGHASHFVDNVEHSTGALGHGLSVGLGIAIGSDTRGYNNRVFVVVGDGELHEGSNWESIMYAGHYKASKLCVLVDKNDFSMMGSIAKACSLDPLADKFESSNFDVQEIEDGHDETVILNTIRETRDSKRPVSIICNTVKGKGISFMENNNVWHFRPPKGADYVNAMKELKGT